MTVVKRRQLGLSQAKGKKGVVAWRHFDDWL
jgi:hypothetical protein